MSDKSLYIFVLSSFITIIIRMKKNLRVPELRRFHHYCLLASATCFYRRYRYRYEGNTPRCYTSPSGTTTDSTTGQEKLYFYFRFLYSTSCGSLILYSRYHSFDNQTNVSHRLFSSCLERLETPRIIKFERTMLRGTPLDNFPVPERRQKLIPDEPK